eukprot:TRINITY_DN861_c0_g1_i2.p2 TRINITY_DN861_c0_g1~~TRINITY_DN861_c0_g1_i2.p2  ORF type:complete len:171 (-),score=14.69 TRINITY_DN861_c0_g1_i2:147-659(-)
MGTCGSDLLCHNTDPRQRTDSVNVGTRSDEAAAADQEDAATRQQLIAVARKVDVHHAAREGHTRKLKFVLRYTPERADERDKQRYTPLHYAAGMNRVGAARLLIVAGADVNAKNNLGWTPLYQARHHKHDEVGAVLREAGATSRSFDDTIRIGRGERLHYAWRRRCTTAC